MFKYNINKITIILNILFVVMLSFYFVINQLSIEHKKKNINKHEKSVNKEIVSTNSISNIAIELSDLPKLNIVKIKKINKEKLLLKPINYIKKEKIIKSINIKKLNHSNISNINKNNDYKIIPLNTITQNKKRNKVEIQQYDKNKVKKLTYLGSNFLKNNTNFVLEFLWPSNIFDHDKIYKTLNLCLKSQTVLMDKKNNIYGLKGLITKSDLNKEFSFIIRVPSFVYSSLEKKNLNIIKTKYFNGTSGKHLRLFRKNIDAYIMGFFYDLADRNHLILKKIKGNYKIINNSLYLDDLSINSINFDDKILLSSSNNKCSI